MKYERVHKALIVTLLCSFLSFPSCVLSHNPNRHLRNAPLWESMPTQNRRKTHFVVSSSAITLMKIRGGARLDGASSWSAGTSKPKYTTGVGASSKSSSGLRFPTVEDITGRSDKTGASSKENAEETKEMIDAFLTRGSRNSFIARVYAILTGQLLVTAISILAFSTRKDLALWMFTKGKIIVYGSLLVSTVAWFVMCLSETARRSSPLKWQLLALFTFGEAISVGVISSMYAFRTVMSALMSTAAATGAVTMYTMMQPNPKYDLSQWGAGLASCGIILSLYGLIHLLEILGVLPRGFLPYSEAIYSALGATLFSFYLAYHTRLIVSGKHTKYQMNEKDYVYGSMVLYMDIINLFIFLLRMLGEDRD